MEILHNNAKYSLNVDRALELGVLTKVERKVRLPDIKNGTVFRWKDHIRGYHTYLMVDNRKNTNGQCIGLSDNLYHTFFSDTEEFEILDVKVAKWVSEID